MGACGLWTVISTSATRGSDRQSAASRSASVSISRTGGSSARRTSRSGKGTIVNGLGQVIAPSGGPGVQPQHRVDHELLAGPPLGVEHAVPGEDPQPSQLDPVQLGHLRLPRVARPPARPRRRGPRRSWRAPRVPGRTRRPRRRRGRSPRPWRRRSLRRTGGSRRGRPAAGQGSACAMPPPARGRHARCRPGRTGGPGSPGAPSCARPAWRSRGPDPPRSSTDPRPARSPRRPGGAVPRTPPATTSA